MPSGDKNNGHGLIASPEAIASLFAAGLIEVVKRWILAGKPLQTASLKGHGCGFDYSGLYVGESGSGKEVTVHENAVLSRAVFRLLYRVFNTRNADFTD